MNASHIERDELTGDWVVIAPARQTRPDGITQKRKSDPFAPSHLVEERVIAAYGKGANKITVIENLFPIFQPKKGIEGKQEILVEGATRTPFISSTPARIEALLGAFAERHKELRSDPLVRYIQAFKNDGPAAGASQPHPHSQIFALSFVPYRLRDESKRRRAAAKRIGMSLHAYTLCLATAQRIIFEDRHVVAFANPAARCSYEVRIVTRTRRDNITQATPAERRSLANALHALLPLMKTKKASFNFFFHDVIDERDEHFEIRFTPRINVWGGFELDAGVFVNPVSAELAAAEYREARKKTA